MSGSLNQIHISKTIQVLENRCLALLSEGYHATKMSSKISIDYEEEDISKEIILSLKANKKRLTWQIRVEAEYRLYNDKTISAKQSPRIDFCFSGWDGMEWEFYAEAKNLIEIDTSKSNRKKKVSSTSLQKRYIETGIDSYRSSKYPQPGCLIGYILQGEVDRIISSINTHLKNLNRGSEVLTNASFNVAGLNYCFLSNHTSELSIKHLMFDYT